MSRVFLIPTLVAAGFTASDPAHDPLLHVTTTGSDDPNAGTLLKIFTQDHEVLLADHRSHRSHSSHSSHRSGGGGGGHYSHQSHTSHRSSAGGYEEPYAPPPSSAPAPVPERAPPQSLFGSEKAAPPSQEEAAQPLSGRTHRFKSIVRRVQIALLAQDLYQGKIDGVVGPVLRAALRKFQESRGLKATGTITPETLDALRVSSE